MYARLALFNFAPLLSKPHSWVNTLRILADNEGGAYPYRVWVKDGERSCGFGHPLM